MSKTYTVPYLLPVTVARFTATITTTTDSVLDTTARTVTTGTAELAVVGDKRDRYGATIRTGMIFDVNAAVSVSDDLRLASASSDTTGRLGQAVSSLLSTVATVAGTALALPKDVAPGGMEAAVADARKAADTAVDKAYEAAHPDEHDQLASYKKLDRGVRTKIGHVLGEIVSASTPVARAEAQARHRSLVSARADIESELTRMQAHFDAWRAGTKTTTTEQVVYEIPVDDLPTPADPPTAPPDALSEDVEKVWSELGMLVTVTDEEAAATAALSQPDGLLRTTEGIWTRVPRRVRWALWRKDVGVVDPGTSDPEPYVEKDGTTTVVDRKSRHMLVEFRRSFFSHRTVKATFSSAGVLTTLEVGATGALADAAAAASDATSKVGSGLQSATTIVDSVSSLRDKSLNEELARAKAKLDLKQAELSRAGLDATDADYAELVRLKQEVDLADQRAKLDPQTLAAASANRDVAVLKAETDAAVAKRNLQAETELSEIRLEVARLRAQWEAANPDKAGS